MDEITGIQVSADPYAIGAFIFYLIIIVVIGIFATRFSSAGIGEFFVGGRKMNRFVVALSAVVSGRSSWLLLGVTGMSYKMGASAVWAVIGYITVELLLFIFYARRLRRFSAEHDCITLPDFFAARFPESARTIRFLFSLIIIIFMISYVSAQFVGGGKAFSAGFGLTQTGGILLTSGIVLFYTVLGGFLAVSLTDMIQAFFMLIALIVLPVTAIQNSGGLISVLTQLKEIDVTLIDPMALSAGALIGFLGIGLGSPGNPHILVRYMSIDDPEQLRYSAIVGTIWNVLMAWGALFIGLAGRIYFPSAEMLPSADTENLYPVLAQQHLHPILFGFVIASIFAAIMSTADSQLLVAASALVRDIIQKTIFNKKSFDDKRLVILSRTTVVFLVILALLMGVWAKELVFWLVLFAWAGLGASVGPTSILSLFWKKTTGTGVIAGLLSGAAVTIIWRYIPALKSIIYELVPGFLAGIIITIIVSLLTSPPISAESDFNIMSENKRTD